MTTGIVVSTSGLRATVPRLVSRHGRRPSHETRLEAALPRIPSRASTDMAGNMRVMDVICMESSRLQAGEVVKGSPGGLQVQPGKGKNNADALRFWRFFERNCSPGPHGRQYRRSSVVSR